MKHDSNEQHQSKTPQQYLSMVVIHLYFCIGLRLEN